MSLPNLSSNHEVIDIYILNDDRVGQSMTNIQVTVFLSAMKNQSPVYLRLSYLHIAEIPIWAIHDFEIVDDEGVVINSVCLAVVL